MSVGVVGGETLIDLEFSEDMKAELDLNIVASGDGRIIEVQGGTEGSPVAAERYIQLVASGLSAVEHILSVVRPQLT